MAKSLEAPQVCLCLVYLTEFVDMFVVVFSFCSALAGVLRFCVETDCDNALIHGNLHGDWLKLMLEK